MRKSKKEISIDNRLSTSSSTNHSTPSKSSSTGTTLHLLLFPLHVILPLDPVMPISMTLVQLFF